MIGLAWLLRGFSYLFHLVLSLSLLVLGVIAMASGIQDVKFEALPWKGAALNEWLVGLGVLGLIAVLCAITGQLRLLFPLWALGVLVMLVRAVFFSNEMTFSGPDGFKQALWLTAGALVAFLASLTVFGRRSGAQRRPIR